MRHLSSIGTPWCHSLASLSRSASITLIGSAVTTCSEWFVTTCGCQSEGSLVASYAFLVAALDEPQSFRLHFCLTSALRCFCMTSEACCSSDNSLSKAPGELMGSPLRIASSISSTPALDCSSTLCTICTWSSAGNQCLLALSSTSAFARIRSSAITSGSLRASNRLLAISLSMWPQRVATLVVHLFKTSTKSFSRSLVDENPPWYVDENPPRVNWQSATRRS